MVTGTVEYVEGFNVVLKGGAKYTVPLGSKVIVNGEDVKHLSAVKNGMDCKLNGVKLDGSGTVHTAEFRDATD